jgi:hypothetical protein
MKYFFFLLTIVFVLASCKIVNHTEQDECCNSKYSEKGFDYYSLRKLGKEYQAMKKKKEKCCDDSGSDFKKLMNVLAIKLNSEQDTNKIIHIMGVPDAHEVPKQFGSFTKGDEKLMIYWWRSWHDFFYFVTENGKVKNSKWFYAFE